MIVSVCGRYGLRGAGDLAGRRRPDHVLDAQRFGNQLQLGEGVGDLLLRLDHRRGDQLRAVALALHRGKGDVGGQPEQRRDLLGHLLRVGPRPVADLADLVHQLVEHLRMPLRVSPGGEVELVVVDQLATIHQDPRGQLLLGGGLVGVPDHPGVDAVALEGGAGVGRRQVDGLDVAVLQAGLLEGADQQVMHVGALVQGDFPALQLGHRPNRRVLRQEDRLAGRRRRFVGHVEQVGAGGLGEYRRGFPVTPKSMLPTLSPRAVAGRRETRSIAPSRRLRRDVSPGCRGP